MRNSMSNAKESVDDLMPMREMAIATLRDVKRRAPPAIAKRAAQVLARYGIEDENSELEDGHERQTEMRTKSG